MKIKVAKYAGFCEGVRRAVGMALDLAQKSRKTLYTCGELIHNPQVISLLRAKGVLDIKEPAEVRGGSLLIRSHGISPDVRQKVQKTGVPIFDATCPHVLRIQSVIKKAAASGAGTVIVGDAGHAEVEGLLGCAGGRGYVVGCVEEVDSLPALEGPLCIVAQTTQDEKMFDRVAACLKQSYPQARVHRTICSSTRLRQEAVRELAGEVDAMVVVGGRNSANTARLAQIASAAGVPTYHIETPEELDEAVLSNYSIVGVTAGASTPNWIIREVVTRLSQIGRSTAEKVLEPFRAAVRFLTLSNLYVAAGAGALTYAASRLLGVPENWRYPVMASLSVLSLHTVNQHLAAREASSFYPHTQAGPGAVLRVLCAAATALMGVVLAASVGWLEGALVALALAVGSIYGLQVAPGALRRISGLRSLRDIPASKELFAAAGWAMLVVILPAISDWHRLPPVRFVAVLTLVFILVYIRSTLLDIGGIERDRAVGREATPFVLGKRRTKFVLAILLTGSFGVLIAGYASGALPALALALLTLPLYTAGYLFLYHQRLVTREISLELLVDGKFLLAGLLAFAHEACGWNLLEA